jgi:penicillin-binding protein 1C
MEETRNELSRLWLYLRLRVETMSGAAWRVAAIACAVCIVLLMGWVLLPLPRDLAEPKPVASVTLLDRHGLPLRTTRSPDGARGGWLSIDRIDPDIIRAFVAAEDQRFYQHHGVDALAFLRAARDNMMRRSVVSGASTITMQTARLLRGTERSWPGKLAQVLWAWRLEAQLEKNQILERYLNRVPLGEGTIGVAAAASLYFEASAADLSVGQAAMLAGFARTPARTNLIASPARARARRALVLERMMDKGYITPADAARAAAEPVIASNASARFLAPHFTTRVLRRLAASATGAQHTTIDLDLQMALEAEVRHTVATLKERAAAHAAVVVLDNASGDVLAWIGSPDFYADEAGQVDMVISPRQPGSTLKPFLYGLAFDRGYTAATVLPDVPRVYPASTGPYTPQNYDRRFRGPVRMREALASSYNVPAVELADRMGTAALLYTLQQAGFSSLSRSPEHYGLGLALGNGDVTLIELANAYRGIANGGVWRTWHVQLDHDTATGMDERRFMSTSSAALLLDILSDPVARMPGFGLETPLDFSFRAAAKTGTSRHYTDNWAIATTASFTVAVWVGNFSGRPMQAVSGITGAGPLLHRAVLATARRYPPGQLIDADGAGLIAAPVCILSGMRATHDCPSMIEWFAPGSEPNELDTWQSGGHITLPSEYAEWTASNEQRASIAIADHDRSQPRSPVYRILSPLDGDRYEQPIGVDARYVSIPLVAAGDSARWSVDGRRLESKRWRAGKGEHVIHARWPTGAHDSVRVVVE